MRLLLFAHYDKHSQIADYVVHYIKKLREVCDEIVFISVSNVSEIEQKKLEPYIAKFINRPNEGYDFGSWRAGFEYIGFKNLSKYNEVVIANDSCYGGIYPFSEMFDEMAQKNCDMWGVNVSRFPSKHLQSYFLVFRQKATADADFIAFWQNISNQTEKFDYVQKYELGLSKLMLKNGKKLDWYCKIPYFISLVASIRSGFIRAKAEIKQEESLVFNVKRRKTINEILRFITILNFANMSLTSILYGLKKCRSPLLKVMLFRDNPYRQNLKRIEKYVKNNTDYDWGMIKNHQDRINPNS